MYKVYISMPEENIKVVESESPPPHLDQGEDIVVRTLHIAGFYHFGVFIEDNLGIHPKELADRRDFAYYIDNQEISHQPGHRMAMSWADSLRRSLQNDGPTRESHHEVIMMRDKAGRKIDKPQPCSPHGEQGCLICFVGMLKRFTLKTRLPYLHLESESESDTSEDVNE